MKNTAVKAFLSFTLSVFAALSHLVASPDSDICPVHAVKMERIELRVVYGMPSPSEFEEMRVAKTLFPHGRDYVLGGCVVKSKKTLDGFLCPRCVDARENWLRAQKH